MLTDIKARTAKKAAKPYKLTDSGGLYLNVSAAGGKVWRVRYEVAGREKQLTVGPYPDVSLAEARIARDRAKASLRDGRDPAEDRKREAVAAAEAEADTFELVAREWYAQNVATWRPRHAYDVIHSLERDIFPHLGAEPISAITPRMVLDVLRPIEARPAIETARRIRQRMSAAFVFAIASGRAETDPAAIVAGAMAPLIRGRQPAVVDLAGVRAILTAADATPAHGLTRLALRLMALTAVRGGEIRAATPAEFEGLDGAAPIWRIPAARMKNNREHVVPLAAQAVQTVLAAQSLLGPRPRFLFPSVRHAHHPMSENAIGYLLNRAGYHGQHVPHGFRAAFSTIMNETRHADRAIIDLMLAHAPKDKVEAAYNRAAHMGRRVELAQEWADMLVAGLPDPWALIGLPCR